MMFLFTRDAVAVFIDASISKPEASIINNFSTSVFLFFDLVIHNMSKKHMNRTPDELNARMRVMQF